MDTEQLKTFLEVNRTRHFGTAARNLFLSQSAVSARIQALEQQLGCSLFVRARNDIQLTPAGQRLLRHAEGILAAWNRARQDITLDEDQTTSLAIGGLPSLWDILLQRWLALLDQEQPTLALHGEVLDKDAMLRRLLEGTLDIGFTFEAPLLSPVVVTELGVSHLILVSDQAHRDPAAAMAKGYIAVDWGLSFDVQLARDFPDLPNPRIRLPLGRIAQEHLLQRGGSAWLVETAVQRELETGRLFRVDNTHAIPRQMYAMYLARHEQHTLIERALETVALMTRQA